MQSCICFGHTYHNYKLQYTKQTIVSQIRVWKSKSIPQAGRAEDQLGQQKAQILNFCFLHSRVTNIILILQIIMTTRMLPHWLCADLSTKVTTIYLHVFGKPASCKSTLLDDQSRSFCALNQDILKKYMSLMFLLTIAVLSYYYVIREMEHF